MRVDTIATQQCCYCDDEPHPRQYSQRKQCPVLHASIFLDGDDPKQSGNLFQYAESAGTQVRMVSPVGPPRRICDRVKRVFAVQ